jgi:hypothetical protein
VPRKRLEDYVAALQGHATTREGYISEQLIVAVAQGYIIINHYFFHATDATYSVRWVLARTREKGNAVAPCTFRGVHCPVGLF